MAGIRADLQRAWQGLFDPRAIGPFLIGSLCLGLLSNAVYEIVTTWFGDSPSRLGMIIAGTVVILVGCVVAFAQFVAREPKLVGLRKRCPRPHRGLVLMVSQEVPCRKAVAYHKGTLRQCWLLCSTKTLPMAERLRAEFAAEGIDVPDPIVINDVNDPQEFRDEVVKIYAGLPDDWSAADVIADYLGMTSHASVGMVLAWWEVRFPLQYTLPIFDEERRPIGAADPIEITLVRQDQRDALESEPATTTATGGVSA